MANTPHIIAQQKVRLRCNGAADALALRKLTLSLCTDELPARLNQLFDRYDEPDMMLRLGRIAVQVAVDDEESLRENLAKAIAEQVEQALRKQLSQRVSQPRSLSHSLLEALCFYLKRGYLPWWALDKEASAFRDAVRSFLEEQMSTSVAEQLMPLLRDGDALHRFISLAAESGLDSFLSVLPVFREGRWRELRESLMVLLESAGKDSDQTLSFRTMLRMVLEILAAMPAPQEASYTDFLHRLIRLLHREGLSVEALRAVRLPSPEWAALLDQNHAPGVAIPDSESASADMSIQQASPDAPQAVPLPPEERIEEDERILIRNAGLVIIAPFLPAFFKNLGLLHKDKVREPSRAVALLRYLCTGAYECEELELVLEKILCGMPLQESVEIPLVLSEEEKEEAESLLRSVIEHWDRLRSTSPDGLRHNFLQREGRLMFRKSQWELTVQKETHDILLDYLPWSVSMIKLPWMKELLIVKWNT